MRVTTLPKWLIVRGARWIEGRFRARWAEVTGKAVDDKDPVQLARFREWVLAETAKMRESGRPAWLEV